MSGGAGVLYIGVSKGIEVAATARHNWYRGVASPGRCLSVVNLYNTVYRRIEAAGKVYKSRLYNK